MIKTFFLVARMLSIIATACVAGQPVIQKDWDFSKYERKYIYVRPFMQLTSYENYGQKLHDLFVKELKKYPEVVVLDSEAGADVIIYGNVAGSRFTSETYLKTETGEEMEPVDEIYRAFTVEMFSTKDRKKLWRAQYQWGLISPKEDPKKPSTLIFPVKFCFSDEKLIEKIVRTMVK